MCPENQYKTFYHIETKRPMGQIASLRKLFLIYIYIILLFRNYLPSEQDVAVHLNKLKSPQPKKGLCKFWLKLARWFWRKLFFSIFTIILFISLYFSPWIRDWPFVWRNWNPLRLRIICAKWNFEIGILKLAWWFFKYFKYNFTIIFPWRRAWPFIWTNLNPFHPRIICAKFGWNWPCVSEEEDFFQYYE